MILLSILKQNRLFFIGYVILLLFGLGILIGLPKAEGHFFLNSWHSKPLDYIFRAFTLVGDGIFIICLAVALLFSGKRYLFVLVISGYLLSGIPVQIIKSYVNAPRPGLFLKGMNYPDFVEGVTLHNYNSFPSGHTTSAFAIAVVLAVSLRNKNFGLLFLFLAAMVGYSRIYLSQHFMEDVFAGSLVGTIIGILVCFFGEKWNQKRRQKNNSIQALLQEK